MKNKKLIIVGIFNIIFFLLIVVCENIVKFKYFRITDIPATIILFLLSFLPFYLVLINYIISKIRGKDSDIEKRCSIKRMLLKILFVCLSLLHLQIISLFFTDIIESYTTDLENYLLFDKGLRDPDFDFSIFPKEISRSSIGIEYYYNYTTFDEQFLNSGYDIYLKVILSEDEYNKEKERIKALNDYEEISNGYFSDSSIEFIKYYNSHGVYYNKEHGAEYNFVAFFDNERKVIYNLTCKYYYPHFVDINSDNIECTVDNVCKIA